MMKNTEACKKFDIIVVEPKTCGLWQEMGATWLSAFVLHESKQNYLFTSFNHEVSVTSTWHFLFYTSVIINIETEILQRIIHANNITDVLNHVPQNAWLFYYITFC